MRRYSSSLVGFFFHALVGVTLWAMVVSSTDSDQTCENPDTCFTRPPADAKYVTEGSYFPSNSFLQVPIEAIRNETHNSKVITFALPPNRSLGITISSAILMDVPKEDGKSIVRPYNPIHIDKEGSFELLIKIYPDGIAGKYISQLQVGNKVGFKQTKKNVKKFQFPFKGVEKITMLAGGTGIAPMYQALVPILKETDIKVRLLYSNKTPQDIMLKKELDDLVQANTDRFSLHYIIGENKNDQRHSDFAETGWIDEEKIGRLAFAAKDANSVVWVCGVDDMYNSLAGSRMKALTEGSALHTLGFSDDNLWRS